MSARDVEISGGIMRRSLRWSLAGVVGLVVAVSLLVIPALGEGPEVTVTGTLRLNLSADGGGDRVIYDPVAPGDNLVQTLSQRSCQLEWDGDPLVEIVGSGTQDNKRPYAGLKDHRIGVGQQGEGTGEPCARINRSGAQFQELTFGIDPDGPLAGQSIGYAEIDLGFKFDGDAELELWKGGLSGRLVDTVVVDCSGGSDCGPDSGASDNERVVLYLKGTTPPPGRSFEIDDVFDTIVFRPGTASSSGSISLEGGFDGSPAGPSGFRDSLFQLVEAFDGEIDCEDEPTVLGGGDDPTFEVIRGLDTNGGCKGPVDGLLYNFDAGEDEGSLFVDFVTDPWDEDQDTVAQFLEVITWRFDDPPATAQFHTLSYDDHLGKGERDMPWCLKDPRVGVDLDQLPSPIDTTKILPGDHTSCLIESKSYVTPSVDPALEDFIVVDTVYNIGDGKRSRG
jgi:hypothetical protein